MLFTISLVISLLLAVGNVTAEVVSRYEVYLPAVERYWIVNPATSKYQYNHDSSLAYYRGNWYAVWNANTNPLESQPGQVILMSTSHDAVHWSEPVEVFNDPRYSENPVDYSGALQWQPNLLVVGEELWCVWSQNGGAEPGTYVSKLRDPGGKWHNERLMFAADIPGGANELLLRYISPQLLADHHDPMIDGKRWRLFPTQNPIQLSSGRVLAPVIAQGSVLSDSIANVDPWMLQEKRATVLITDNGEDWWVSPGTTQLHKTWAVWEPTVWELPDGRVMMFVRNLDPRTPEQGGDPAYKMLLYSISEDQGETWSPLLPVPIETVSSRMHVLPLGQDRWVMVHNDFRQGSFVRDRMNIALFFSRSGELDFIPGIGITATEEVVAYPQMWIHDDGIYVIYSQGNVPRGIKVVKIWPLPDPDTYYVFPRANVSGASIPTQLDGGMQFFGEESLTIRWETTASAGFLSLNISLVPQGEGVIFDNRSGLGSGFAIVLANNGDGTLSPGISLGLDHQTIYSQLRLPLNQRCDLRVNLDQEANKVSFFSRSGSQELSLSNIQLELGRPVANLGSKRFPGSQLPGLVGIIERVRIVSIQRADAQQSSEGGFVTQIDLGRLGNWPEYSRPFTPTPRIALVDLAGKQVLEIYGEASAGLELPRHNLIAGDIVELGFQFKLSGKHGPRVIATIGYGDAPVRIQAEDDGLWLLQDENRFWLGPVEEDWMTLQIVVGAGKLQATLTEFHQAECSYSGDYVLAYLGQGYLQDLVGPEAGFLVDIASIKSGVR